MVNVVWGNVDSDEVKVFLFVVSLLPLLLSCLLLLSLFSTLLLSPLTLTVLAFGSHPLEVVRQCGNNSSNNYIFLPVLLSPRKLQ